MMITNKLLNSSFKNLLINNNNLKKLTSFKLNKYSTLNDNDDFSIISTKTQANILNSQNNLPLLIDRKLKYPEMFNSKITPPKEAWLEDFTNNLSQKLAIVKLHPIIFGHFPRTDLVKKNLHWQQKIHWVNFLSVKVRNELPDSTKKPWPQKGSGRARHGSKRSPQWKQGGWVHGPRGPMTSYRNLHYFVRVRGLCSVLSAKFAQNDLKIIKDLESFDSDNPKDLVDALEERRWGPSCLFVDTLDIFPKNISLASHPIDHINLMPVYGLNVHSMLKHETLILTMNALNELENKILLAFNRIDLRDITARHEPSKLYPDETPEFEGVRWVQNLHKDDWI